MESLIYVGLDSERYADFVANTVKVDEVEDLTGKVPHAGYGGAVKSTYISPKDGQPKFVLERHQQYAPDAWGNDVWIFADDFTAAEASEFILNFDKTKSA